MSTKGKRSTGLNLTDPLSELGMTGRILWDNRTQNVPTFVALNNLILGGRGKEDITFKSYNIMHRRLDRLTSQINEIPIDDFDISLYEECHDAISAVRSVFSPEKFHHSFNSVINENLREHHLTALRFSGPHIRKIYPLCRITDEDINVCTAKIDAGIQELESQPEIPTWALHTLRRGAIDLKFALNNISFFGQDPVHQYLLDIISHTNGYINLMKVGKIAIVSLSVFCSSLVTVSDVVSAPKNIAEGLPWWQSTANSAIELAKPLLKPPPLLIEGPKDEAQDRT